MNNELSVKKRKPNDLLINQLLLEHIESEIENLNDGEVFFVKDLFKGYIWNRIESKIRKRMDTIFLNRLIYNPELCVQPLEITSTNYRKYKKYKR